MTQPTTCARCRKPLCDCPDSEWGCSPLTLADFSPRDCEVIRERRHGWEQATAKDLASIFGTTTRVINQICRDA